MNKFDIYEVSKKVVKLEYLCTFRFKFIIFSPLNDVFLLKKFYHNESTMNLTVCSVYNESIQFCAAMNSLQYAFTRHCGVIILKIFHHLSRLHYHTPSVRSNQQP